MKYRPVASFIPQKVFPCFLSKKINFLTEEENKIEREMTEEVILSRKKFEVKIVRHRKENKHCYPPKFTAIFNQLNTVNETDE